MWVSQNFLTSAGIIGRLICLADLNKNDHVIEIGPGKGHITRALLARCRHVTAVEIDERLCAALRDKFAGAENLTLVNRDFLHWPLPARGAYKVFANIPFSRTTDIVRRLTEFRNAPSEIYLVMEKGAAKRFLGRPRETLRSLLLKPRFDAEIVYHFRREDFHPMPGVDTVLLHLRKKETPDIPAPAWSAWERYVEAGLRGGARALRGSVSAAQWSHILHASQAICSSDQKAARDTPATPEALRYVQWLCLFRCGQGSR